MAETVTGRAHPALPSAARRVLRRVFPRVFPCILLAAVLVLCLVPDDSRAVAPGTAEFIFFDVGQGDASLIRTESGCVLIDTGTNLSEDTLAASLEWLGVRRIDCLILTHAHEDHIGGADRILRDFDVRAVIARDTGETDAATRRLWDAVRVSGAEQVTPAGITTYTVGGLCLDVAVPFAEPQSAGNDNSLIVRVRFGETTFLYMGDAEAATEQVLLARLADGDFLDCDGLKLGHHGSDSSSGSAFLRAVSPRYAVASAGGGNSFGHPHARVLADLEALDCTCLRTDASGTVVLVSDGRTLRIGP